MASIFLDFVFVFNGSLSSMEQTLLITSFTREAGGTLSADGPTFDAGDSDGTFEGVPATYIGGGTAVVGVDLLGIPVNLSNAEPVFVFESGGRTQFFYPDGEPPEMLNDLATQILATPALAPTLALLGISGEADLVDFLEENALLTVSLDPSNAFPICLTRGTLVLTPRGEIEVERLRVGDLVVTADNGAQPIRWIGRRRVVGAGRMAPVLIRTGSCGNRRDLRVSQQHRMLVQSLRAGLFFGETEVLAPARGLIDGDGIRLAPCASVEYVHLFFDRHEVIFAEGCPTESFHPGRASVGALDAAARDELLAIFPDAATGYVAARPSLRMYEARLLARHPASRLHPRGAAGGGAGVARA